MVRSVADPQASPASHAEFDEEPSGGPLQVVVQFVAIPLLIVSVAVGLFFGVRWLSGGSPMTVAEYVQLLRSDTINRRWQAAAALAHRLKQSPEVPPEFRDPKLTSALAAALTDARSQKEDPPRTAMLIIEIMRRLEDPDFAPALRAAMKDENDWIRSYAILGLGSIDDLSSRPAIREATRSSDAKTRQAALVALAALDRSDERPNRLSPETRRRAFDLLGDVHEDVRFQSALLLAQAGDVEPALPVLKKMLDREYLRSIKFKDEIGALDRNRIHSNLIMQAIKAVSLLDRRDEEVVAALVKLSDSDTEGDIEVRELARKALERMKGLKREPAERN